MGRGVLTIVAALLLFFGSTAGATTFVAEVIDEDGHPVVNAVVALASASAATPPPASRLPNEKTIDQRNETFIPLVTIVPKGGRVLFSNNDQTTHQVYSFSAVKRFEITIARGETSAPILFDNQGVAALGCNIHDHMIAYVYVADSPWTALTGADGHAVFNDIPRGAFEARLWHPQFPGGRPAPGGRVDISSDDLRLVLKVKLVTAPPGRMAHSHAGTY
jgi:plastocyanin